jgi:hypothetical protein
VGGGGGPKVALLAKLLPAAPENAAASARMFNSLVTWLNDHDSDVFFVGTCRLTGPVVYSREPDRDGGRVRRVVRESGLN